MQEPNEFYLHHLPQLKEAVVHVSAKVTVLKTKVEIASYIKVQWRRQKAKHHANNVTEESGNDCHMVEAFDSDSDGPENDCVVIENDVEEI